MSATERSRGGLRIRLNPDALERAYAAQGLSFARLAIAPNLSIPTVLCGTNASDPLNTRA
jgi:hypothetical protein